MSQGLQVITRGASPVVVKRRSAPDALQAEAARLRLAWHPGVIPLVELVESDGAWELRTAWSGRPLSAVGQLSVHHAAQLVAHVAETLADLHELGVVHGHISASHVLVGPTGRACLCGLGASAGGAEPADDVAAVGELITELLARLPDADGIPERRFGRRAHSRFAGLRRALLTLADQATADVATRRPTARRLAADIVALVGTDGVAGPVRPPDPPGGATDHQPHQPAETHEPRHAAPVDRSSPRRWIAALVAAAVALAAGVALRGSEPSAADPADSATPPAAGSSTACTGAPTGLDADGDGCDDAVEINGAVVTVGGRRWAVGDPGDVVVVGDWDCDGVATPATLRPSTGEVFVFDAWASQPQQVSPSTQIPGAVDATRVPGARCDALEVRLDDGRAITVELDGTVG